MIIPHYTQIGAPTSGRRELPPKAMVSTPGDQTCGSRLCAWRKTNRQTFPLADPLPSTDSVTVASVVRPLRRYYEIVRLLRHVHVFLRPGPPRRTSRQRWARAAATSSRRRRSGAAPRPATLPLHRCQEVFREARPARSWAKEGAGRRVDSSLRRLPHLWSALRRTLEPKSGGGRRHAECIRPRRTSGCSWRTRGGSGRSRCRLCGGSGDRRRRRGYRGGRRGLAGGSSGGSLRGRNRRDRRRDQWSAGCCNGEERSGCRQ
jgi:hypothetical protein